MTGRHGISVLLLLLPILAVQAEPGYITDKLKVGLHQDNLPDSPITQVLPTGTPVEVVKHEAGWIIPIWRRRHPPVSGSTS